MSLGILGLEVLAGVALTAMHMISPFMINFQSAVTVVSALGG